MTGHRSHDTAVLKRVSPLRAFFQARKQRRTQREIEEAFRTSPWPLYGLPPEVPCQRFVGGWGRSGKTINSLELAHLPPDGSLDHQLRIEVRPITALDDTPEDFARGLWRRAHLAALNAAHPDGDFESLRRDMDKVERDYEPGSTITWEPITLMIDGQELAGQHARYGNDWVALLETNGLSVVISGQDWPDHLPGLVTIHEVESYIEGSRRNRRHRS